MAKSIQPTQMLKMRMTPMRTPLQEEEEEDMAHTHEKGRAVGEKGRRNCAALEKKKKKSPALRPADCQVAAEAQEGLRVRKGVCRERGRYS